MLPKPNRLQTNYEFSKVQRYGQSYQTPYFILICYQNPKRKNQPTRFGFIASKKFDKRAVKRNRARRLMREAVLKNISKIKNGYDVVLVAKHNIKNASFKEVFVEFNKILSKVSLA
ncbi:MAG: ribonuclease P protein component [Patescibacteria group bacterium]|nr:ribonuclease P protein component [Patescibacteria group bacterium]